MEPILCVSCFEFFPPSPRHKNQSYCMKPKCQKARKANWKRTKMIIDPDFKEDQRLSTKKWLQNNPDYWKNYRNRHPEKTQRNRMLQHIRNRRQRQKSKTDESGNDFLIAKVDASKSKKINIIGQFWMVPVIAKVDALKVNIFEITKPYQ
jgi:hypothetical protein